MSITGKGGINYGMQSIKLSCGGGMTSSTISVNFNDTAEKTVFTATEKCILKLVSATTGTNNKAAFKLNNTNIGTYDGYLSSFQGINRSLANLLSFSTAAGTNASHPAALILYLEKGDTVYATRTSSNAFTVTFNSAVFTF